MTQHKIFLRHDEVKEFVKRASACDFDIDISYNHYTVDAKSILGVLALDFRQALTVCCHGYDEGFEKYLGKYAIALLSILQKQTNTPDVVGGVFLLWRRGKCTHLCGAFDDR